MAATTATTGGATDEFNTMINRNSSRLTRHHSDETHSRSSSAGSTTLAPSTLAPSHTSVRSSAHRSRRSIASALDRPRPVSSGSFYHDSSDNDDNDDDNAHDSSDSNGDRTADAAASSSSKKPSKYYLPQTWDKGAMTGPKGVIADAQAFEREKMGKRSSDFHRTKDLTLPRAQQFGGSTSPRRRSPLRGQSSRSGSEELTEEDDEHAVRAWREKRMQEMRETAAPGAHSRSRLGGVRVVNGNGFLEAVEGASRGMVVVVLIFDDDNELSHAYSEHLHTLSKKYPSHRFVALSCQAASIDAAACPALLAYKNGDQFAQIMPLQDEVPFTCNVVTNMEECLRKHDILGSRFDVDGL